MTPAIRDKKAVIEMFLDKHAKDNRGGDDCPAFGGWVPSFQETSKTVQG